MWNLDLKNVKNVKGGTFRGEINGRVWEEGSEYPQRILYACMKVE
jgi:hypothetical protein